MILIVVVSTVITIGIVYLIRGRHDHGALKGTEDIEGIYVTALAAFYGVFISFMIFMVWGRYYDTLVSTEQEASALATIYRLAPSLQEPYQARLQAYCVRYANVMIKYEWPSMAARQEQSPEGRRIVAEMWDFFNRITPVIAKDEVIHDHLLTTYVRLTELRRYRLLQARTGLPGILYAALIFGAILTVALAILFSTEPLVSHLLKAVTITSMIVLLLYTIWVVDYPFQGDVYVPPTAFAETLKLMQ